MESVTLEKRMQDVEAPREKVAMNMILTQLVHLLTFQRR